MSSALQRSLATLALPLLGGLSLALASGHASAQAAQDAAADASDTQVGEVIVSARRRNESVQDAPLAITALSTSQLESTATVSISDLQGAAPNVLITKQVSGASAANISIRGIAFADIEKSFDPAVGVLIDGVYIGTSTGQLLDFFDIDSIEILRGPQGTLFGRNTIGGVINIQRSRPTGVGGGKFELSYGEHGTFTGRGVLNTPLLADKLAAKFFYFRDTTDGYYHNAFTGKDDGGGKQQNAGVSLLFTPIEGLDALLTLERQTDNSEAANSPLSNSGDLICLGLPGGPPANECNRNKTDDLYTTFTNRESPRRYRAKAATLEANWQLEAVKLTSISSYRESRERQFQDVDASSIDFYDFDRRQRYHQFSQELRAAGNILPTLDYVAGVYYFNSTYFLHQDTLLGPILTGAPAAIFGTPQEATGTAKSSAAFLDIDWSFMEHWRLSLGGRYTKDKKGLDNAFLAPPAFGGFETSADKSFHNFSPKVSVDYRPTDDLMLYASWSKGYRSGGFNGRGATPFSSTLPYDPETVKAYELGLKSELLDKRMALNLAAFYTDYSNIQQSTNIPTPPGSANPQETVVTNGAKAKLKGFEADLTARPMAGFTLRASLGYTDSGFRGLVVNQPIGGVLRTVDLSDVDMIYAPKITASLGAEYSIPLDKNEVKLTAGWRHLDKYDQQIAADPATPIPATGVIEVARNDPRLRSDVQNLVDASFSYLFEVGSGTKAHFTLYGRNLLDDRGPVTSFTVGAFPTLWVFAAAREPRTYGATVGFEF